MLGSVKNFISKYNFSFILFIFFLLFSPPIIPQINTALFAFAVAFALLIAKRSYRKEIIKTVKDSGMMMFVTAMIVFFLYIAVITVVNVLVIGERVQLMHYVKLWYRFFMIIPVLMICCIYICLRAKELKYSVYDLSICFITATMVQFVFVIAALFFPAVKKFFTSIMYVNTGDGYLNIPWVMARRGFGFVNTFVDSFGFGMGLIAALPLFFIKKGRWKLAYLVPCLLFVSIVNVRTGLIVAGIGLLMSLPVIYHAFKELDREGKKKAVLIVLVAILILIMLVGLVKIFSPLTINWIIGDMNSVVETVLPNSGEYLPEVETDSETTTAEVLFSDRFWNIPIGKTILFGSGHTIYGAEGYPNSDVGYVNDLWLGGIIGCVLLYGAFVLLFIKAFKNAAKLNIKMLVIFFALSILVFQIKANAIMFNAGLNTMLPMLFYICLYGKEGVKE